MTLFELFESSMWFVLLKKKVRIYSKLSDRVYSSEEFLIGDVPYRLLKKEVILDGVQNAKTIVYDGVVEIFVK
jgi:hypothetical protein